MQSQDEPVEAQHAQSYDDRSAGILVHVEADLAGHDEPQVLMALRDRFSEVGIPIGEESLRVHARRIASLDPNDFSRK